MQSYQDRREEILRETMRIAEVFARREATKSAHLEDIMKGEVGAIALYKLIVATEGLGLYGIGQPVSSTQWNLLRDQITRYELLVEVLPKSELKPLELVIQEQVADIAARSRNIESIQPLVMHEQLTERLDAMRKAKLKIAGEE
jgi:hypothetical protein